MWKSNAHSMAWLPLWWRDHSFLRWGVGSNTLTRNLPPSIQIFHQHFAFYPNHKKYSFKTSKVQKTFFSKLFLAQNTPPLLLPSQFVPWEEMYFVVIVASCLPYWLSLCRGEKLPIDASYSCFRPPRHALVLLSFTLCFPLTKTCMSSLCHSTVYTASYYSTVLVKSWSLLHKNLAKFHNRESANLGPSLRWLSSLSQVKSDSEYDPANSVICLMVCWYWSTWMQWINIVVEW